MNRYIYLVAALLASCQCDSTRLVTSADKRCNQECYTGSSAFAGKGNCSKGVWNCYEDGGIACVGSVLPEPPVCDGTDHDCDGKLDAEIAVCQNQCGELNVKHCIAGVWEVCNGRQPTVEICNGKDDDCDGLIDNVVYTNPFCYDGPPNTIGKGECRPGFYQCVNGVTHCAGEILPQAETCDLMDNDCNGIVDDVNPKPRDIAICVDESGSMGFYIDNVKTATQDWASRYNNTDFRFALLTCPGMTNLDEGSVKQILDFTNASSFIQMFRNQYSGSTGSEPTIDTVHYVAKNSGPVNLTWRSGVAKTLIIFSDEGAQTYAYPMNGSDDAGVELRNANIGLDIFTAQTSYQSYQSMINIANGKLFNINAPPGDLSARLDSIVNGCQ